jgi:hypothetical protein
MGCVETTQRGRKRQFNGLRSQGNRILGVRALRDGPEEPALLRDAVSEAVLLRSERLEGHGLPGRMRLPYPRSEA